MGDGKKLKAVLQKHGVNIKQLSRMTGINPSTLYSIVQKDSVIRFDYGIKIASELGIDVNEICSKSPFSAKLTDEEVCSAISDIKDEIEKEQVRKYLIEKLYPICKLFGKDMEICDKFLRAYYQLPDMDRKEMAEHLSVTLKYHTDSERKEKIKALKDLRP